MEPTIHIALRSARKAGDMIVQASERLDLVKVKQKEANDYVTNVDHASEKEIIFHIQKAWYHNG